MLKASNKKRNILIGFILLIFLSFGFFIFNSVTIESKSIDNGRFEKSADDKEQEIQLLTDEITVVEQMQVKRILQEELRSLAETDFENNREQYFKDIEIYIQNKNFEMVKLKTEILLGTENEKNKTAL